MPWVLVGMFEIGTGGEAIANSGCHPRLNQIAAQIGSAFGATLGHADVTAQRCLDCVCGAALVAGRSDLSDLPSIVP